MTSPDRQLEWREHFAQCVQLLGGPAAAARRLGIDERAIRRFASGEREVSEGLMRDMAQSLRELALLAQEAESRISGDFGL